MISKVKLCKGCKFCSVKNRRMGDEYRDVAVCCRPRIDLVSGEPRITSYFDLPLCSDERQIEGSFFKCGPEAKFYE